MITGPHIMLRVLVGPLLELGELHTTGTVGIDEGDVVVDEFAHVGGALHFGQVFTRGHQFSGRT